MILFATLTASLGDDVWPLRLVRRRARDLGLSDICYSALSFATPEHS